MSLDMDFGGVGLVVGKQGPKGDTGKSAYELAVEQGFEGTVDEWFGSLFGGIDATLSLPNRAAEGKAVGDAIAAEREARAAAVTGLSADIAAVQAAVGAPRTAATAAAMTDTTKVYVYTGSETGYTAGNWYYHNGTAWVSGGIYNATAFVTDEMLSERGEAADAAAVGRVTEALAGIVFTVTKPSTAADGKYDMEIGGFNSSTGASLGTQTSRAKTSQFSFASNGIRRYDVSDDYDMNIGAYSGSASSSTYLGSTGWRRPPMYYVPGEETVRIRFMFRHKGDTTLSGEITAEDLEALRESFEIRAPGSQDSLADYMADDDDVWEVSS